MNYVINKLPLVIVLLITLSQYASANSSDHHNGFYVTPKAVVVLGNNIDHDGHRLEGEVGFGIGIDLGYEFIENFAIEFDTTYVEAGINSKHIGEHNHETETGTAKYTTYAINLAYMRHLIKDLSLVLKLGYEWEHENIEYLGIQETLSGIDYAVGLEYEIAHNMEIDFEFEGANVESARGNSFLIGLKYLF